VQPFIPFTSTFLILCVYFAANKLVYLLTYNRRGRGPFDPHDPQFFAEQLADDIAVKPQRHLSFVTPVQLLSSS